MAADTQRHLDCYAKEGLRTLCFTKKVPDPQRMTFYMDSVLVIECM